MDKKFIMRTTKSICPICLKNIKANIVEKDNNVYFIKECEQHGTFKLLLSTDSKYYLDLYDYYFSIIKDSYIQKDFILHLTNKCNLNCPICLANANEYNDEYSYQKLKILLLNYKYLKIDIMGAEPTMREDLSDIINLIKRTGNVCALHTNGIKLADYNYCKLLKDSGLDEVHLQYDTFIENTNLKIRGQKLIEIKEKTIENLEKLNISTDIVMTILKDINEKEINAMFSKFSKKKFIKEIFFLGHRPLGKTHNNDMSTCLMPDEVLNYAINNSNIGLTRQNMKVFQKLYFAMLSLCSKRKCFYIHHYIYFRYNNEVIPIHYILNIDRLDKLLDNYKDIYKKSVILAKIFLIISLPFSLRFSKYLIKFIVSGLSYLLNFIKIFNLSNLSDKLLLIGFITACDLYSYDDKIAKNCGKGVISAIRGINDNGALDNIIRDRTNNENISTN